LQSLKIAVLNILFFTYKTTYLCTCFNIENAQFCAKDVYHLLTLHCQLHVSLVLPTSQIGKQNKMWYHGML